MLSYMSPAQQDSQAGELPNRTLMQLDVSNVPGHSTFNKETSVNSFISDSVSSTSLNEKSHFLKISTNGTKQHSLKRVSFGSSKGSMVETLIFENQPNENVNTDFVINVPDESTANVDQAEIEKSKVLVKFFQQGKLEEVDLPNDKFTIFENPIEGVLTTMENEANHMHCNSVEGTDNGWENPFRPGGDLSREADEIVELIKGGKPITPTSIDQNGFGDSERLQKSPQSVQKNANGNAKTDKSKSPDQCDTVNVKHTTLKPDGDGMQAEQITIKKKSKCKCCVIQ